MGIKLFDKSINEASEHFLRSNRFIVIFGKLREEEIEYWTVKALRKPPYSFKKHEEDPRTLTITLYNASHSDMEIREACRKYNNAMHPFIKIIDLDATGCELASEYYMNPQIISIQFGERNSSNDDFTTYELLISFDEVKSKL